MRQKSYTIVTLIIIFGMILLGAFKPEAKTLKNKIFLSYNQSNIK